MRPWIIDARETINDLEKVEEIDFGMIEQNESVKRFLEDDKYRFLIATKGLGKSLLLLAKRKRYSEVPLIPEMLPLDVPIVSLQGLTKESLSRLYEKNDFILIWSLSIVIAIVKRLQLIDVKEENVSETLQSILTSKIHNTIADVFNLIIGELNRRQFLEDLASDYNKTLLPTIRNCRTSIVAFIDNVDECFRDYKDLWYISQNNIMKVIYDLRGMNSKIKLFTSIRKEVYLKLSDDMKSQYSGVKIILSYEKDELRDIFIKNILKEDESKNILKKEIHKSDPITAFIGAREIQHGFVDEREDIFDYIYRHSLQRPRDLMLIGSWIISEKPAKRNLDTKEGLEVFKELVNKAGTDIVEQYLPEVLPHLTINKEELYEGFKLIDSNVLERHKVKEICMKFNGNNANCMQANCKECNGKRHIFCELYKVGLVGYVHLKPTFRDEYVQRFSSVGENTFHDVRLLPDSPFYLIHPILDGLIRIENDRYKHQINGQNIVGYDRPWKQTHAIPIESVSRPGVFISSTMDLKVYRNRLEEVVIAKNFASVRSEFINSPNSLDTLIELAANSHYFVAVLGPRYGDEIEGKSVCEHEFDAAYKDNPNKIVVYIVEGQIGTWEQKQQHFVNRIQSLTSLGYARGDRVTPDNLKYRFEKDLVERIARITKWIK